jgi:hypothetical protein
MAVLCKRTANIGMWGHRRARAHGGWSRAALVSPTCCVQHGGTQVHPARPPTSRCGLPDTSMSTTNILNSLSGSTLRKPSDSVSLGTRAFQTPHMRAQALLSGSRVAFMLATRHDAAVATLLKNRYLVRGRVGHTAKPVTHGGSCAPTPFPQTHKAMGIPHTWQRPPCCHLTR